MLLKRIKSLFKKTKLKLTKDIKIDLKVHWPPFNGKPRIYKVFLWKNKIYMDCYNICKKDWRDL